MRTDCLKALLHSVAMSVRLSSFGFHGIQMEQKSRVFLNRIRRR
jgi:hypothetical protein